MASNSSSGRPADAGVCGLVGASSWTRKIRAEIATAAACPSTVLITGPTGTGKEVIARSIHALSVRAGKPFIPVDCAGVAGPLFASHIFGHLKGAFTGAGYAALGCFRAGHGGTVFLDEIGELDAEMQTKLLRVLQQRTVTPLGSHEEIPVDVRVIAATNRDLDDEVRGGRFREDLFYRLHVVGLRTVPLRERPEDIGVLACHFLNKLAITHGLPARRLSKGALARLQRHDWPGNVRQLENVLERAAFSSRGPVIGLEKIVLSDSPEARDAGPTALALPVLQPPCAGSGQIGDCCMAVVDGHWRTMEEVQREHIRRTLVLTAGNQSAAARLLGMERHQLARKLHKYGLVPAVRPSQRAARRAA